MNVFYMGAHRLGTTSKKINERGNEEGMDDKPDYCRNQNCEFSSQLPGNQVEAVSPSSPTIKVI